MKVSWTHQDTKVLWTNPPDKPLDELKNYILFMLPVRDRKKWEASLTEPFHFED